MSAAGGSTLRVWASSLAVAAVLSGLAWQVSAEGRLTLHVTDHAPAVRQFSRLDVELASVSLHRAGEARRSGWVEVPLPATPPIDIVPLKGGLSRSLGAHPVAVGDYDAVRVRFDAASGVLRSGDRPSVRAEDAVVAIDVTVTDTAASALTLDLYAEDQTEHRPPGYVVKVKAIRRGTR